MYVEAVRKVVAVNSRRAQTMNVKLYSCDLETFQVQGYIARRSGLPLRSYAVDLRNRRCECVIFQTIRYSCAHVHAACARTNLNVEQFIDEIYTLQRTLCIWGNEFLVMFDVSNWEVPPPAFEMVSDRSLRRHLKGRPQSTIIQNDMDVRETGEPKLCTVCRTSGHNRSTCPHPICVSCQSSCNVGFEDDE
ncbi:hypothetical protein GOBAR_DD16319 [Gossypium barbadense]|nr:hypothetical protein GOBAR_DD16319 [Gossypium barbadense]